jgi:hypothetical protein
VVGHAKEEEGKEKRRRIVEVKEMCYTYAWYGMDSQEFSVENHIKISWKGKANTMHMI